MQKEFHIRGTIDEDVSSLMDLYPRTFPEEDLTSLVRELIASGEGVLNLSALNDDKLVGHIAFTQCQLSSAEVTVSLLGPLAVDPEWQKQGIGSDLVHEGLRRVAHDGCVSVLVFGDPQYYGRFGFKAEEYIKTPYPIPDEWQTGWQSLRLSKYDVASICDLYVPPHWQKAQLWGG